MYPAPDVKSAPEVALPLNVGAVAKRFVDGVPALWRSLVRKAPKDRRKAKTGAWARELASELDHQTMA